MFETYICYSRNRKQILGLSALSLSMDAVWHMHTAAKITRDMEGSSRSTIAAICPGYPSIFPPILSVFSLHNQVAIPGQL